VKKRDDKIMWTESLCTSDESFQKSVWLCLHLCESGPVSSSAFRDRSFLRNERATRK
jgi:hypothetical protein